jgi:hypothetical protein
MLSVMKKEMSFMGPIPPKRLCEIQYIERREVLKIGNLNDKLKWLLVFLSHWSSRKQKKLITYASLLSKTKTCSSSSRIG